jgi:hypothetical protein
VNQDRRSDDYPSMRRENARLAQSETRLFPGRAWHFSHGVNTRLPICACGEPILCIAVAPVLPCMPSGCVSSGTLKEVDLKICDAVLQQLEWHSQLDASAVGVAARDDVVTLTGYIDTYAGKTRRRAHGEARARA